MSDNKSLRDYINIVEARQDPNDQYVNDPYLGLGGAVQKGKEWAGSAIDRAKHFMEPAVSSDPTLQAHKARIAAQQPAAEPAPVANVAAPTDTQSAKVRRPATQSKPQSTTKPSAKTRPAPTAATTSSNSPRTAPSQGAKPAQKGSAATAKPTQTPSGSADANKPATAKPAKTASDPGVMQTQQFLKNLGYDIKLDGIWGPKTEEAYRSAFPNAPSNRREPTGVIKPAASGTLTPDAYTQGKLDKTGQSADMAAAVGMPNPYVKPQTTGAPLPTGRDASGKPYTDWYGNNPQPGAKSLEESEMIRIKDLVNYKK